MTINEKAAYIKGLLEGSDMDQDKKETKILKAMAEWMSDVSIAIEELEEDMDDVCEQMSVLDEDLADVEDEVFEDDCDCCDCGCDCDCDDDCDCGCHDEEFYEVVCPSCKEQICFDEDTLLDDEMDCPNCGEHLEFDLSEMDDCDCCDCEDDDCDCGCHCGEDD